MKTLIKNCKLISMSDNRPQIEENVDILIEGDKIAQIGKNLKCDGKVINADGKIVMPGLINTHVHLPMSVFRETVDGYQTQEWLKKKIWPMEDKLQPEDIYWASKLSCIEMIKTGTTTINDMYFEADSIVKAALETGIRMQTTRTLVGTDRNDNTRLDELKALIEKYDEETITFNAGIHGFYTSSEEYVEKCVKFAEKQNLPIHIHFCENQQEREDIIRDYDAKNPAEVIKRHFKGIHNILAHSVKVSDEDIEIIKGTNSYIAHCPVSNLKLGCGVAPIAKMIDNGICVSLGTDGQGSGSNLDMFEAMKFTALLQKGINERPELLPAYDVLKMATVNGAKALGLDKRIGTIEEEKSADLIIVDLKDVIMKPTNNIFAELVYNAKGYNVNTTIVNGKVLMENRKLNVDVEEAIEKCEGVIKRIK